MYQYVKKQALEKNWVITDNNKQLEIKEKHSREQNKLLYVYIYVWYIHNTSSIINNDKLELGGKTCELLLLGTLTHLF